jgi:hypothetical protein
MRVGLVGIRTSAHSDNVGMSRRLINWLLFGANYSVISHNFISFRLLVAYVSLF